MGQWKEPSGSLTRRLLNQEVIYGREVRVTCMMCLSQPHVDPDPMQLK